MRYYDTSILDTDAQYYIMVGGRNSGRRFYMENQILARLIIEKTELEKRLEQFASGLSDTLLFITADHSQIESKNFCLMDYPEITECLVSMPSIEPRTLSFRVRDEYKKDFPDIFRKAFGDKFWILTKEEIISKKLFGIGKDHELFSDMLGDYICISVSDVSIFLTHKEADLMPGGHAGLTKEELEIPLIAVC